MKAKYISLFCITVVAILTIFIANAATDNSSTKIIDVARLSFGQFEYFAHPIHDYIEFNRDDIGHDNFMMGIHDIIVFQNRLYIGYGDANLNLGRKMHINIRCFESPEDTAIAHKFDTDEEQIEVYRKAGNCLFIPGIDATEDGWLGNVYYCSANSEWQKSRTLDGGVHVHDIAEFRGDMYAVGSGGTPEEWKNGIVSAHLWVSEDGGENFSILHKLPNPDGGDSRWICLLPIGKMLHIFGYQTSPEFDKIDSLPHYTFDGVNVNRVEILHDVFVRKTFTLDAHTGLIIGVDRTHEARVNRAFLLREFGETIPIDALANETVIDAFIIDERNCILLTRDGCEYPATLDTFHLHIHLICMTGHTPLIRKIANYVSTVRPSSIAFWMNDIYLGMNDGTVLRARGKWE